MLTPLSPLQLCTRAKVTKIDLVDDGSGTATAKGVSFLDDKGEEALRVFDAGRPRRC